MRLLAALLIALSISCPTLASLATWEGDTVISGLQSYDDTIFLVSGNVTIRDGGRLILNDCQFLISSESDGHHAISVEAGGRLDVIESQVSSTDPEKHYWLVYNAGSAGSIEGSTVTDAIHGVEIYTPNIVIRNSTINNSSSSGILAGDGASNFLITTSTIEGNEIGIIVIGNSSGEISHNQIISNESTGILLSGEASAIISDNIIRGGNAGLSVNGNSSPEIENGNNTFEDQTGKAIYNPTENVIQIGGNNWGTDDPDEIADLITGPTNYYAVFPQVLTVEGVSVNIPAGAASSQVVLTVETIAVNPGNAPSSKILVSDILDFQGTVSIFTSPISITIPTERGHYGLTPYYWDTTTSQWTNSGLAITGAGTDSITFTTDHFSYYAVFASVVTGTTPICVPSPFAPPAQTTTIIYWLDVAAPTTVFIFDHVGTLIWKRTYTAADLEGAHADYNRVVWDGSSRVDNAVAENGPYIVKVFSAGRLVGSTKVAVIR